MMIYFMYWLSKVCIYSFIVANNGLKIKATQNRTLLGFVRWCEKKAQVGKG